MSQYWMIRKKETKEFLPSNDNRGFTKVEPTTFPHSPRLFSRKQDAKTSLTWWLKGITSVSRNTTRDPWNGDYDCDESWHLEKIPERKREDYEIIGIELKEVT